MLLGGSTSQGSASRLFCVAFAGGLGEVAGLADGGEVGRVVGRDAEALAFGVSAEVVDFGCVASFADVAGVAVAAQDEQA